MRLLHAGRQWREAVAGAREQLQSISMNGCSAAKRRWPSDVAFVDLRRRRTDVDVGAHEEVRRQSAVPQGAASRRNGSVEVVGSKTHAIPGWVGSDGASLTCPDPSGSFHDVSSS